MGLLLGLAAAASLHACAATGIRAPGTPLLRLALPSWTCSAATSLSRVLFNDSFVADTGARCLDGSPAGLFFRAGDPKRFVIYLQGGGACFMNSGQGDTNCFVREKSALGSSTYWAPTMTDDSNLLSSDPSVNPTFATFTKVFVPYCGGDVHVGTRTKPVSPAYPFYFSGHLIVTAVIAYLEGSYDLAGASQVLLSGSSAGGIGTFVNADFVRERLPNVPDFRAAPQGGLFFPDVADNFTAWQNGVDGPPYAGQDSPILALWQPFENEACVAAKGVGYCGSVSFSMPFVKTALHISENQEDSNQLFAQLGVPANLSNPLVRSFVAPYFQNAMRASLSQLKATDAVWAPACVAHTENLNLVSSTRVSGVSLSDSLSSWYSGSGAANRVLTDTCDGISCNPTCPPLAAAGDGAWFPARV